MSFALEANNLLHNKDGVRPFPPLWCFKSSNVKDADGIRPKPGQGWAGPGRRPGRLMKHEDVAQTTPLPVLSANTTAGQLKKQSLRTAS